MVPAGYNGPQRKQVGRASFFEARAGTPFAQLCSREPVVALSPRRIGQPGVQHDGRMRCASWSIRAAERRSISAAPSGPPLLFFLLVCELKFLGHEAAQKTKSHTWQRSPQRKWQSGELTHRPIKGDGIDFESVNTSLRRIRPGNRPNIVTPNPSPAVPYGCCDEPGAGMSFRSSTRKCFGGG